MKQGSGHTSVTAHKTEPKSHAISVPAVAEIGTHTVRHTKVPIYEGRGLKAPMVGQTNHHRGSQGKH